MLNNKIIKLIEKRKIILSYKMGIQYLNYYLKKNCSEAIKTMNLSDIFGKTLVIDTSIYMYLYETENCLLENIFLLISTLKKYNIIPIFIFDGIPPKEKKQTMCDRYNLRIDSLQKYNELKNIYKILNDNDNDNDNNAEKKRISNKMTKIKQNTIYLTREKILKVKKLIKAYGCVSIDSPGEADGLCSWLVINNKAWACLSEDMDMFVYGCTKVIRSLNLKKNQIELYDMDLILDNLKMTQFDFTQICIISGTDYSKYEKINIFKLMKYYQDFKSFNNSNFSLFEWIKENEQIIIDNSRFENIKKLFEINYEDFYKNQETQIKLNSISFDEIKNILLEEGFMFP